MAQRLIDANELREVFEMMGWKDVVAITDGQPTIDPVKHGKWIPCENGGYYCSNCDRRVAFLVHNNYCPNCGARMDGE